MDDSLEILRFVTSGQAWAVPCRISKIASAGQDNQQHRGDQPGHRHTSMTAAARGCGRLRTSPALARSLRRLPSSPLRPPPLEDGSRSAPDTAVAYASWYWWARSAPIASTAGMSERADDAVTAQPPLALASRASDGASSGTAATYRLASAARSCPDTALANAAGIGAVVMRTTARRPGGPLTDLSDGERQRRRIIARARERRTRERPHYRTGVAGQWLDEAGRPGACHRRLGAVRQADHQVGYGVLRTLKLSAGTGVDNHADAQRRRRKRIHADRLRPPVLPQPEGLRVQRPARAGNRDDHTDV